MTKDVGGRSQTAHRTAIERLAHAGAVPATALAVVTERAASAHEGHSWGRAIDLVVDGGMKVW